MKLKQLSDEDLTLYKKLLQEAFQYGYESFTGKQENEVVPDYEIEESLHEADSHAYVMVNDEDHILGGAIVILYPEVKRGLLDFILVKVEYQGQGIGQKMWKEIETLYPEVEVWEATTPYFDVRNIHFYVNKLKFKIVEFYNTKHKESIDLADNFSENLDSRVFRFEKVMK